MTPGAEVLTSKVKGVRVGFPRVLFLIDMGVLKQLVIYTRHVDHWGPIS